MEFLLDGLCGQKDSFHKMVKKATVDHFGFPTIIKMA